MDSRLSVIFVRCKETFQRCLTYRIPGQKVYERMACTFHYASEWNITTDKSCVPNENKTPFNDHLDIYR